MREILFRGKSVNDYWIYGNFNFYPDINRTFIRKNNKELLPSFQTSLEEEVSKNTIGQYTGLTDKNGKKIFEGDIIKHFNSNIPEQFEVYQVEFDTNRCMYVGRLHKNWAAELRKGLEQHYEVIGNIHDNPELLKEREG